MNRLTQFLSLPALLLLATGLLARAGEAPPTTGRGSVVETLPGASEVLRLRLVKEYVDRGTDFDVFGYLKTQSRDGSWPTIDYGDTLSYPWKPMSHLNWLSEMAIAYHTPSHPAYHSPLVLQGIERGLAFWYERKPRAYNSWFEVLGKPLALGRILFIMRKELDPALVKAGAGYLYDIDTCPGPNGKPYPASTWRGANLVWLAAETIYRGVIKQDNADVQQGVDYLTREVEIGTAVEGIQPDFSFHQHNHQLYNGGYGLGYFADECKWVERLEQTRFAFTKDKIDILTNLLLDGNRWMVRGNHFDFNVQGREATRMGNSTKARSLLAACGILARTNPARSKEIEEMQKSIRGEGPPSSITGNKHFWRSDYMAHQRQKCFVSVKMVSDRTVGTEMVNNENIKGFWLPFGLTYILQRGDEYKNILPTWDWARLPGVTSPYRTILIRTEPEARNGYVFSKEKFVGGVSDGNYGVAAMSIGSTTTSWSAVNKSLSKFSARKSWFFFDDEFIALGSGISSDDDASVGTTLNQCLLQGHVLTSEGLVNSGEDRTLRGGWVLHDGIGYLFPEATLVNVKTGSQAGSWNSINSAMYENKEITGNVFTLWIEHGFKPGAAEYQYIVLPGTDAKALKDYSANPPLRTLSNSGVLQAVRHERLGICGVVFYAPGKIHVRPGLELSVDKPCLMLVHEKGRRLQIHLADPTAEAASVTATLATPNSKVDVVFDLPKDGMAGSTICRETLIPTD